MFCAKLVSEEMESSPSSSTTPKTERRIIEKNRRNHMKSLYSKLNSLLPDHCSKEALPLPDQVDEAVKYIKTLEKRLEKSKEKKENLKGRKRQHTCTTSTTSGLNSTSLNSPQIEISKMGPDLDVVFITGLDDQFIFHKMIRLIHEEGAEVVNASFSVFGNSILHLVHPKIGESTFNFGAARISEKLKMLVHGSTSEVESQPQLWDFEIQSETWEFEIPQVMHMGF